MPLHKHHYRLSQKPHKGLQTLKKQLMGSKHLVAIAKWPSLAHIMVPPKK